MQIKGIKRGKTIELLEEINIPDGSEVSVDIQVVKVINTEEQLQKMKEFLSSLSEEQRQKWRKIGEFLDKERRANREMQQQKSAEYDEFNILLAAQAGFWKALEKFLQETDLQAVRIEPEIFQGVRDLSPGREGFNRVGGKVKIQEVKNYRGTYRLYDAYAIAQINRRYQ